MIINRAKFNTAIGILHYLWKGTTSEPELIYLGTEQKSFDGYIEKILNLSKNSKKVSSIRCHEENCLLIENEIREYTKGRTRNIDLKISFLSGTPFEKNIWNTAQKIPYGQTLSYGELASKSGYPGAGRAAGSALGKNPLIFIIPCHRIIKSDGSLGGFSAGTCLKKRLLDLEGILIG